MKALPLVRPTDNLHDAMSILNAYGKGIVLVVDTERRLLGTLTDGDFRRALLDSPDLERPVSALLDPEKVPLVAAPGHEEGFLLELMRRKSVRQIPITDIDGRVVDLVTMDELLPTDSLDCQAVILAGGFGRRLAPLTDDTPKPMLPIKGKPLLEITLGRLRQSGIRRVGIITHHLAEQIMEHFGDGSAFGLEVSYLHETQPLGTAGALGAVEGDDPILVLNGDLLTDLDYRAMLTYHREQQADLTVAVRRHDWPIAFGVVDCEGQRVKELIEKPTATVWINCGIYLVENYVQRYIPPRPAHMTHIVEALLKMGRPVAAFPVSEQEGWVDIGSVSDYQRAQEEAKG